VYWFCVIEASKLYFFSRTIVNYPFPLLQAVKDNFRSALVVAFVSLPLSASLGVASGVNPIMGIATSIW